MKKRLRHLLLALPTILLLLLPASGRAQSTDSSEMEILGPNEWREVDRSIDRGLRFLAATQEADGRFPSLDIGQPGVTSLVVMAFLASGHLPGQGEYGEILTRAVDFAAGCQKEDGLIALVEPEPHMRLHGPTHTGIYNHAITGLMLSEIYGMTPPAYADQIRPTVEKAVEFTRLRQTEPKQLPQDQGGWRYLKPWPDTDSDLSVTSWQLMFLRSARNAGFEVPSPFVDEALAYVKRCFISEQGSFVYSDSFDGRHPTRGMAGAGILSLSLGGQHQSEEAKAAADWVLEHGNFQLYNYQPPDPRTGTVETSRDRYHYGAWYCTQGMFQLGGDYWKEFFPPLARTLMEHQRADGSWWAELGEDSIYGHVYTSSLCVLILATPRQLLPIYQR